MIISLTGLGPNDKIQYNDKWYSNGAIIDIDSKHAEAYINAKLAIEIKTKEDGEEALLLKELEMRNNIKRKEINIKKSKKDKNGV